jgi:HlyD family secretion protein
LWLTQVGALQRSRSLPDNARELRFNTGRIANVWELFEVMTVASSNFRVVVAALSSVALSTAGLGLSSSILLIDTAQAQSAEQNPLKRAKRAVESLINHLRGRDMPEGIVKSNGRLEATQVDVAAKYPGRLATLTVDEGDEVTAGQVVATISSPETEAQLRSAQAQVLKSKKALAEAIALIAQRKSDLDFTRTDYERGKTLGEHGNLSQQMVDLRRNKFESAEAAYVAANAQRDEADASIKAAEADVERLQSILVDLVLLSPRSGRVQYRLARAGEVIAAGQRVLTILDLNDVYMTIYLPADAAGRLTLGDEARTILDPVPQYVLPNTISFVATEAQFTPKSVETAEEREKLMFRVKLQGDPKVLDKYHRQVKTGVRGLGFVRTDPNIPWPKELDVKLPQ